MKTRVSPTIVGAFAIGAFALGIMALLFFGGVSFFQRQQRFVIYFNESIQGLNLGSPVKLQGVHVGRVVDLNVRYDQAKDQSFVAVTCEFNRNLITDAKGSVINVARSGELKSLVDHGLRAQLGVLGLATGLLYVELDFLDPHAFPAANPVFETKLPVVPSVPSTISEFQASVTEILTKVRKIDFAGLADNFKGLLADARKQVDGVDLKGLVDQWQKTGASVNALATSPQLQQTFTSLATTMASLRSTLADLHTTLARLDSQVDVNGKDLQATLTQAGTTLKEFDHTAADVRRFIDAQQNLGDDAHRALTQLADAAASVQRLADFLERNPNALLSGRKPPP